MQISNLKSQNAVSKKKKKKKKRPYRQVEMEEWMEDMSVVIDPSRKGLVWPWMLIGYSWLNPAVLQNTK